MKKIVKSSLLVIIILVSILFLIDCKKKNKDNQTHVHEFNHFEYNDSTCTEVGNIEYWQCNTCDKLFTDNNGENEITANDTVISIKTHTDDDHNYKCDFQCGTLMIDKDDIAKIIENTYALQEVKLKIYNIISFIYIEYYVENGLIYFKDENIEQYVHNNRVFDKQTSDVEWSEITSEIEVEYNLGFYLKNQSFDFSIKQEINEVIGYYGYFVDKEGIEFDNNSNQKMIIYINNDQKILEGFQAKDENGNIIYEITIELGKIESHQEKIQLIIEELKTKD